VQTHILESKHPNHNSQKSIQSLLTQAMAQPNPSFHINSLAQEMRRGCNRGCCFDGLTSRVPDAKPVPEQAPVSTANNAARKLAANFPHRPWLLSLLAGFSSV
jgi:hypothetical protein